MEHQMNSTESPSHVAPNDEELFLASSKFESSDELLASARDFYGSKGYGLTIRNSKKDKFVILQCDRSGSARVAENKKRSTVTRLINCPFRLIGKKGSHGSWIFQAKTLTHNHDPSTNTSGHLSFRRLSADSIKVVKDMTLAGIPPRHILSSLRQKSPNLPAVSRTIYNLKAKFRKDSLGNRSKVSALFEEFEKGGFSYDLLHDSEGHITSLFIAHPLSIKLARVFPSLFVMDCTYKTNIYYMPLLDIIGVSCFNTSFYSGFGFLEREDEENYTWALNAFKKIVGHENRPFVIVTNRELALMNAIKNVYLTTTNLLCVWHIEKNVLANCKKYFECAKEFDKFMLSWSNIVYSTTETEFVKNWGELHSFCSGKIKVIEYLENTWLPWREKFVSTWTDKSLHFGNRSSSRGEGAHAKLKKYLQVSTGGFQEVKDRMSLAIEHEFNEIKVRLSSEKIHVVHDCNMPLFKELLDRVSHFALKEIYEQYKRFKEGNKALCTGHFMETMGLSCSHKIEEWHGKSLPLELIHSNWRIDTVSLTRDCVSQNDGNDKFDKLLNELHIKFQMWPENKKELATKMLTKLIDESDALFEPVIQRPKGRPPKSKKKKGITSTRRDLSRFEHVESSQTLNSSTSTCVERISGTTNDFTHIFHDNNSLDLNLYSDFSSDYMLLE